ncbi:cell wall anchor protein [Tenacibaculum discolor]|uniref:cell wall anchor protein n=1 Tax=Tenacibaculum discolor TaxID=361581 RepID=UPI003F7B1D0A
MKKIIITALFVSFSFKIGAQTADNIKVLDTRYDNFAPSYYNHEVKFEFKKRENIGVPGTGYYSGLLTFAPWSDNSGRHHHQLNFNEGGLFYRNGLPDEENWNAWKEVLVKNADGSISTSGRLNINTTTHGVLNFSNPNNTWQYIQYIQSGVRKAYVGISPSNNFVIGKNDGGNISLLGGNVGIGTNDTKGFKLGVYGKIAATEVKVATYNNWPDYVFTKEYKLPTLQEVAQYIKKKGHLQNIPSAKEVQENKGIELGEMNRKLLEKIEELTLYTIQQQKEIEKLKSQNKELLKLSKDIEFIKQKLK